MIEIIDTFKDYKNCFQSNLDKSLEEKIDIWQNCYILKYPELEKKCKEQYESNGYNWRQIAEEMVFNNTKRDFNKMVEAYDNLIYMIDDIYKKVEEVFRIDLDLNLVLYSGLCNSAGWVDKYNGKRAILYGIDKIAELNWHTKEHIENYTTNESEFKQMYLKALYNEEIETRDFFGDWYEVLGISDVGYFLGSRFIKRLYNKHGIEYIAKMDFAEMKKEVIKYLKLEG